KGICRVHGLRADAATPLDIEMLGRIIDAIPDDLAATRDRALLLVGFFCALRRSELVALAVEDLDRRRDEWIVKVRRSKTDPFAKGQYVQLPAFQGPHCPTNALAKWLSTVGISEGAVFRTIRSGGKVGAGLPAPQVGAILRARALEAGLDVHGLSAHSLR